MGPTWDPPGSCRPQMGPMLAPWTLLSGINCHTSQPTPVVIVINVSDYKPWEVMRWHDMSKGEHKTAFTDKSVYGSSYNQNVLVFINIIPVWMHSNVWIHNNLIGWDGYMDSIQILSLRQHYKVSVLLLKSHQLTFWSVHKVRFLIISRE